MATTMTDRNRYDVTKDFSWDNIVRSAMAAGVISGSISMLVIMTASFFSEAGFFTPLYFVADTLLAQNEALMGGIVVGLIGAVLHFAVSVTWAGLFALVAGSAARSSMVSLILGLIVGLLAWLVMTYFVIPWANPLVHNHVMFFQAQWFLLHVLFGALLALTPVFMRAPPPKDEKRMGPRSSAFWV